MSLSVFLLIILMPLATDGKTCLLVLGSSRKYQILLNAIVVYSNSELKLASFFFAAVQNCTSFNGSRGPQTRFQSDRMSTTFDIESNPCHVSFSEHFLVNVGAASRMWSVYSGKP